MAILLFVVKFASDALAAAFGAFSGAFMAFYLESKRRMRRRSEERYHAVIRAQTALFLMTRRLVQLRSKHLRTPDKQPIPSNSLPHIWISPSPIQIDIPSVTFLFRRDYRSILANLAVAEAAYLNAVDALLVRNTLWKEVTRTNVAAYNPNTKAALIDANPVDLALLDGATAALHKAVDSGIKQCTATYLDLREAALVEFPLGTPDRGLMTAENITEEALIANTRDSEM
jgi:hypothetical protein